MQKYLLQKFHYPRQHVNWKAKVQGLPGGSKIHLFLTTRMANSTEKHLLNEKITANYLLTYICQLNSTA